MKKSIHDVQYQTFVKLLRDTRLAKGVTQEQLASLLNLTQGIISKIESCERRVDLIEARKICAALEINFLEFISKLEEEI